MGLCLNIKWIAFKAKTEKSTIMTKTSSIDNLISPVCPLKADESSNLQGVWKFITLIVIRIYARGIHVLSHTNMP